MAPTEAWNSVDRFIARARINTLKEDAAADLADAALDCGREAEALRPVIAAAQRYKTRAVLWQWVALLHRALDEHEAAARAFDRASKMNPSDVRIAHGLARTKLEAGLPATALFDRALALAPTDSEILLGRAAARCADGDEEQAIEEIDTLLARNPGWLAGHELSARLRYMYGQRDTFTISLQRALAVAPRDPNLWRTLLVLLIHADRFEEALAVAGRARTLIGDHIVITANEAAALSELGRNAEADAIYARIVHYDDVSLAVRHIRHLLRTHRIEAAAARAEPLAHGAEGNLIWPYLSIAWRMLDDPRWAWLEGDPSFVGEYDLRGALPPIDRLAGLLRGLHLSTHQPLDQSLRGGTQTDGNLFQRIEPEIRTLRRAIADAVRAHIDQLPKPDPKHPLLSQRRDRPVRFAGSWSVRLTGSGHHAHHNHPVGWLSSAFYVVLPEAQPADGPDAGCLALGIPQAELGLDLPATRMIRPKAGHLALFPSTMWHGTMPFSAGERMTVAFDVAPPGPAHG
jgi:tetratricopeptide (TPR) repeat protein